jgi:hypothetical protein
MSGGYPLLWSDGDFASWNASELERNSGQYARESHLRNKTA